MSEISSGTLWVHNVHFGGKHLTGGIRMQEPGATVVMRDVVFDRVYGSLHTNHAELLQTWCGPKRLLIDGLTGSTDYQGLFMLPDQSCSTPLHVLRHPPRRHQRHAGCLRAVARRREGTAAAEREGRVHLAPPEEDVARLVADAAAAGRDLVGSLRGRSARGELRASHLRRRHQAWTSRWCPLRLRASWNTDRPLPPGLSSG